MKKPVTVALVLALVTSIVLLGGGAIFILRSIPTSKKQPIEVVDVEPLDDKTGIYYINKNYVRIFKKDGKYAAQLLNGAGYMDIDGQIYQEPRLFEFDGLNFMSVPVQKTPLPKTSFKTADGRKIDVLPRKDFILLQDSGGYLAERRGETGSSVVETTTLDDSAKWELSADGYAVRFINKASGLALTSFEDKLTATQVGTTDSQKIALQL